MSVKRATVTARIVTAPRSFMKVTQGMTDIDRVDFWLSYLFHLDRDPECTYADYLPIWRDLRARIQRGQRLAKAG
jgi:hypothetical protein